MRALAIAATGMAAQQTNVEVIANNIANINTTAFKRARAEFSDLIYQSEAAEGVPNRGGEEVVPEGAQIGLGVRTVGIRNLHIQGRSRRDLQPARCRHQRPWLVPDHPVRAARRSIRAPARSTRTAPASSSPATAIVVEPAITFPHDTLEVVINESGEVYARTASQSTPQLLGQLSLVDFANDSGLQPLGNNLYRETAASGTADLRRRRRSRLRQHSPGLPGKLQRRSGQGDHRTDLGAARLRDELEGDPGRRRDAGPGLERHPLSHAMPAACAGLPLPRFCWSPGWPPHRRRMPPRSRPCRFRRSPSIRATRFPATMLTDGRFPSGTAANFPVVGARGDLVGKVARRTLLPGRLIARNAVGEPELVQKGTIIPAVYEQRPHCSSPRRCSRSSRARSTKPSRSATSTAARSSSAR